VDQKIIKLLFHLAGRQIRIQLYLFGQAPLIWIVPYYVLDVLAFNAD